MLDGFKMFKIIYYFKFYTMKDLKKLTEVKILSKKEQKNVKGGSPIEGECYRHGDCEEGKLCLGGICVHDD